jgi:hypothetical protein
MLFCAQCFSPSSNLHDARSKSVRLKVIRPRLSRRGTTLKGHPSFIFIWQQPLQLRFAAVGFTRNQMESGVRITLSAELFSSPQSPQ